MRKPKFAGSWLCALLCMAGAVSPVKSADRPSLYLQNVSLVAYDLFSGDRNPCAIDREALNTAIDFVANQSTKLKLIRQTDHWERGKELFEKVGEAGRKFTADVLSDKTTPSDTAAGAAKKALDRAVEISRKYSAAPTLRLFAALDILVHNGSCIGTVSTTVTASLKPSKMIVTGKFIPHPYENLWEESSLVVGPPSEFSRFVIETSERTMKKFVNDWALSQE